MHVAFVRLGLGELLTAVLWQEDVEYIGCEQKMFDEGMKCLDVRDKLVHKSKSVGFVPPISNLTPIHGYFFTGEETGSPHRPGGLTCEFRFTHQIAANV
jgi:hypothetical protein